MLTFLRVFPSNRIQWHLVQKRSGNVGQRFLILFMSISLFSISLPLAKAEAATGPSAKDRQRVEKVLAKWTVDPDEKIQKELQRIAKEISKDNFLLYQRLERLQDLTVNLNFIEQRLQGLNEDNSEQLRMIQLVAGDQKRARKEAESIVKKNQEQLSQENVLPASAVNFSGIDNLPDTLSRLQKFKDERTAAWMALEKSNSRLHEIRHEFYREWLVKADRPDSPGAIIKQWRQQKDELKQKEALLAEQEAELKRLATESAQVRDELKNWQESMADQDEKLTQITHDLAAASLELFEKERTLVERETQVNEMRVRVREYEERMALSKKIISEKETVIQQLREEMELAAGLVNEGLETAIDQALFVSEPAQQPAAVTSGGEGRVIQDAAIENRPAQPNVSEEAATSEKSNLQPAASEIPQGSRSGLVPTQTIDAKIDNAVPVATDQAISFDAATEQPDQPKASERPNHSLPNDFFPLMEDHHETLHQLHTRKYQAIFSPTGAWSAYVTKPMRKIKSVTSEVSD